MWFNQVWHFLQSEWVLYSAVVLGIYSVASKSEEVLAPSAIKAIAGAVRNYNFVSLVQAISAQVRTLVDNIFRFRKFGSWFVPSLQRSLLVSLALFFLVALPVRVAVLRHFNDYLSSDFSLIRRSYGGYLALIVFLLFCNFVNDYISFAKSRSILEKINGQSGVRRTLLLYLLDALITILSTIAVLVLFFAPIAFFTASIVFRVATADVVLAFLLTLPALYIAVQMVIALTATALFISFCALVVGSMTLVVVAAYKIDRLRELLTNLLNFENKPNIAIGVVVIVVFTAFYWPVVLFMKLFA
jgi:hypothetical protein